MGYYRGVPQTGESKRRALDEIAAKMRARADKRIMTARRLGKLRGGIQSKRASTKPACNPEESAL